MATSNRNSADISDSVALEALLSSAQRHEASKTKTENNRGNRKDSTSSWRRRQRQDDDSRQTEGRKKKSRWGSVSGTKNSNDSSEQVPPAEKEKPNFAVSNALAKDLSQTITTGTGASSGDQVAITTLKFSEPPEARIPNTQWRIYVFSSTKGDDPIATWHISKQSAYLFGRDEKICDIPIIHHPSTSKQHAVLQYRFVNNQCKPYILDLESTNGTFVNKIRIDSARYYELKRGDVLRFGSSAREYVLLTEHSKESHIFK